MPFVFTEHGILMLANVLKSDLAIKVSIRFIEVFIKIREMLLSHEDIQARIVNIEGDISEHKGILKGVLEYIKDIEQEKEIEKEQENRKRIGFKTKYDEGD